MPPGWKEAYRAWAAAGWNGLAAPAEWGGQGLPRAVNAACIEMWNSASMAFGIGPVLTMAAVDALAAHGSGRTEADLSAEARLRRMDGHHAAHRAAGRLRRRRAAHQGRARRRRQLSHHRHARSSSPMASTTSPTTSSISCWRALAGAPAGTKGLSLFLVPKFLLGPDGTPGARNDLRAHSDRAQARASTPRRPAPWSMATTAAPSATWSARKTAAWRACSP